MMKMSTMVHSLFHTFLVLITIAHAAISLEGSRLQADRHEDGIVTSIESIHGDIYDCYDVYKQPSLKDPALRGHKVKLRPSFDQTPDDKNDTNVNSTTFDMVKFWKSGTGCPQGSVPIWRETRNKLNVEESNITFQGKSFQGVDFAGMSTKPGRTFYGASATINIQAPKVPAANEYSSAAIFIEGYGKEFNQIETGWTVNPQIYHDHQPRFFIKWVSGRRGCFDTRCPGFILTGSNIPLGATFTHVSQPPYKIYDFQIFIRLEWGQGWWVHINDPGNTPVGYWPINIFNTLRDGAYLVKFGGEIYTSPNNPSPQMGSGVFSNKQYEKTCYMRHIRTVDQSGRWIDGDNNYMQEAESRCFYAGDNYYQGPKFGYAFLFGGRGGFDQGVRGCIY